MVILTQDLTLESAHSSDSWQHEGEDAGGSHGEVNIYTENKTVMQARVVTCQINRYAPM